MKEYKTKEEVEDKLNELYEEADQIYYDIQMLLSKLREMNDET